jgi:hypothetical protein
LGQEASMEDAEVLGWIRQRSAGACSIFSVCTPETATAAIVEQALLANDAEHYGAAGNDRAPCGRQARDRYSRCCGGMIFATSRP